VKTTDARPPAVLNFRENTTARKVFPAGDLRWEIKKFLISLAVVILIMTSTDFGSFNYGPGKLPQRILMEILLLLRQSQII
jgi:hypothetical protein